VALAPGVATSAPGGGGPGSGGNAPVTPGGRDGGSSEAFVALAAGVDLLTNGRPSLPLGVVTTLVATSGIVGATLAFGLFGKRRRDDDPPDELLSRAAASPLTVAATAAYLKGMAAVAPAAAAPAAVAPAAVTPASDAPSADATDNAAGPDMPSSDAIAAAPHPLDAELSLPRWRRPSLLEARKADPIRDAQEVARLTFDHGLVGPIDGRERRLIRYNLVRLLDIPDELRGTELQFLDQGDEVELVEKRGVYWLVLCPDGQQGWIHKMTLGETIGEPPVQSPPTATMPTAADTWTMGDDIDGDVLTAYLESRRRL
jgi:hypothetical protein